MFNLPNNELPSGRKKLLQIVALVYAFLLTLLDKSLKEKT
jgi:hypothetical protein